MGVCEARGDVASLEDLIKQADDALYLAKAQGRARCVIAEPRPTPPAASTPTRRHDEAPVPRQSAPTMMLPSR